MAVRNRISQVAMEKNQIEKCKVYEHYNHTDSCRFTRWTARECYQYMYARPWEKVNDFYLDLVNQRSNLSDLFSVEINYQKRDYVDAGDMPETVVECKEAPGHSKDQSGRWARSTFKIVVSYHGKSFDGWQKQPGLNTVQGLIEGVIGRFIDKKKAQQLKDKGLPIEGSVAVAVAGRTDKGVSALNQICSFYTWVKDVNPQDIEDAIDTAGRGILRVVCISKVSRAFHPNFSAKWRRYLYIFPLGEAEEGRAPDWSEKVENSLLTKSPSELINGSNGLIAEERSTANTVDHMAWVEGKLKPMNFSVTRVNKLLEQLEGKLLSYKMFARDTKASRNIGPPTECFVYHARATKAKLPCSSMGDEQVIKVMCVELIANRFLRKMVRVLVATAVREAAAGAEEDALLKLMEATCRRATAPPAPPDGLCLVDVGYEDFGPRKCFIH
ncbi:hypothetical protein Droror1_Dr00017730 [Drosera rotundifolia]